MLSSQLTSCHHQIFKIIFLHNLNSTNFLHKMNKYHINTNPFNNLFVLTSSVLFLFLFGCGIRVLFNSWKIELYKINICKSIATVNDTVYKKAISLEFFFFCLWLGMSGVKKRLPGGRGAIYFDYNYFAFVFASRGLLLHFGIWVIKLSHFFGRS